MKQIALSVGAFIAVHLLWWSTAWVGGYNFDSRHSLLGLMYAYSMIFSVAAAILVFWKASKS